MIYNVIIYIMFRFTFLHHIIVNAKLPRFRIFFSSPADSLLFIQSWESRVQLLPPSVDGHTKARMMCRDPTKTCPVFHLSQMNLPVQSDTFEKTQLWVHLEILGSTLLADTIRKAHVQSYFTVTFRFFQIQFGSRAPGKIADLPHFFVLSNLPNGRDSAAIWRMFCRGVE